MIDSFDGVQQEIKEKYGDGDDDVVEEALDEMKSFFEQRLAATL